MDCFPFFLNIYLFLFNAQLVSTVDFNEICHLQCKLNLPSKAVWVLMGFGQLRVKKYAGKAFESEG